MAKTSKSVHEAAVTLQDDNATKAEKSEAAKILNKQKNKK